MDDRDLRRAPVRRSSSSGHGSASPPRRGQRGPGAFGRAVVIAATGRSRPLGRRVRQGGPERRLCAKTTRSLRRPPTRRSGDGHGDLARPRPIGRAVPALGDPVRGELRPSSARKQPSRTSARSNGSVVWMPVTSTSSRARRNRRMALASVRGRPPSPWRSSGRSRVARGPLLGWRCRPGRPGPAASATSRCDPGPARTRAPDPRPRAGPRWRAGRRRGAAAAGARDRRVAARRRSSSCSATRSRSGDELGDPVLDLEPGVDFEEPEPPLRVEEELRGRRVGQAGGAAARTAIAWSSRRSSPVRPGAGVSSTSF